MSLLSSAFLGAAKGGLTAGMENVNSDIEARKQAALDKRERSMLRLKESLYQNRNAAKNARAAEEYEYKKSERNRKKADSSMLAQSKRQLPHGGDEYEVAPDAPEEYIDRMSPEGYISAKGKEADQKAKDEADSLDRDYKQSMINKNNRKSSPDSLGLRKLWQKTYSDSVKNLTFDGATPITPEMEAKATALANKVTGIKGTAEEKKESAFDSLLSKLINKSGQPPQNPTPQAPPPEPQAPEPTAARLPGNPEEWGVTEKIVNGKRVYTANLDGEEIQLTNDELKQYYNYKRNKSKQGFNSWYKGKDIAEWKKEFEKTPFN